MDDTQRFLETRYKLWIDEHVRFSDLDPLGHVNNNAIGQYFENARANLFVNILPRWPHNDQLFVLGRTAIDFRRELHMPADLRVGICITALGRTSMQIASALFGGKDGIAYCESVSVFIDHKKREPTEIPFELRQAVKKYLSPN